jgi:hypothetical protein
MRSALLVATSAIALAAAVPASAGSPNFSYVPNSLIQSTIVSGPWTLHETASSFAHDASGILPKFAIPPGQTKPPYKGAGYALLRLLYPFGPGYDEPRPELDATLLFPIRATARPAA